jgi:4-amino-4-deoxy-L-arabinose transferase-like glycosyltransferase
MKQRAVPWEAIAFGLILIAAFVLRIIGLRWGLPNQHHHFSYHPDEAPILQPTLTMIARGDGNPHFFNYGTLYLYITAFFSTSFIGLGIIRPENLWPSLHLVARSLTVVMGVGTVAAVYFIARRTIPAPWALVAAALVAVAPMHALHGHFATVDVPATFFLALALLAIVVLADHAHIGYYILSGSLIGLAAATKYTMALALLPLLVIHFIAKPPQFKFAPPMWYLAVAAGCAVAAFVIACPYAFVVHGGSIGVNPEFKRHVLFEMRHMKEGGTFAFANTGTGWGYHFLRSLPCGLGIPFLVAALVGIGALVRLASPAAIALLVWSVPYFVGIGAAQERFLRYTIPLVPLAAISAAALLHLISGAEKPTRRGIAWAVIVGIVLVGTTAWYCGANVAVLARDDPRDAAGDFLRQRLAGKTLGLAGEPWYLTPSVVRYNGGLPSRQVFEEWREKEARFKIVITGWDAHMLKSRRPDYFAVSDMEYADPVRLNVNGAAELMKALDHHYTDSMVFENEPGAIVLGRGKAASPPDWLYARPRIIVFAGWRP